MRFSFALLFILLCLSSLCSLEQVGQLSGFSGEVTLDAQGKAVFIKPLVGDALYNCSVIKTGKNGTATITIYSRAMEILPDSLVRLADILQADNLKAALGINVFTQLEKYIKNLLSTSLLQVETSAKGTVETTRGNEVDDSFITRADIDKEVYAKAKKAIMSSNYGGALLLLRSLDDPGHSGLGPGEYELLSACCYFFPGYYRQAAGLFAESSKQFAGDKTAVRPDYLDLSLGVACYLAGNDEEAIVNLRQFLQTAKDMDLMPYGYHILCHTLLHAGRSAEAKATLQTALRHFTTHPLHQEWTRLVIGL